MHPGGIWDTGSMADLKLFKIATGSAVTELSSQTVVPRSPRGTSSKP